MVCITDNIYWIYIVKCYVPSLWRMFNCFVHAWKLFIPLNALNIVLIAEWTKNHYLHQIHLQRSKNGSSICISLLSRKQKYYFVIFDTCSKDRINKITTIITLSNHNRLRLRWYFICDDGRQLPEFASRNSFSWCPFGTDENLDDKTFKVHDGRDTLPIWETKETSAISCHKAGWKWAKRSWKMVNNWYEEMMTLELPSVVAVMLLCSVWHIGTLFDAENSGCTHV